LRDDEVTYGSYLALDELLQLQRTRSGHPDELLFIIVHQASELWFREILHELDLLIDALTAHEPTFALFRMGRLNALMRIVSAQLSALDTLPPQHFAEFRGHLGTSSGSQSVQFRAIEATSGLREPHFMQVLQEHGPVPDVVQRALSRPPLQDLFLELLRAQHIELEALYTGAQPTTEFFLAEALLERLRDGYARYARIRWRRRHRWRGVIRHEIQLQIEGFGQSRYRSRTIDQRFFPTLWAVRAKFYGSA